MATFDNGESGLSVRNKINAVLQHADGTAGEIVFNDAGADVDFRIESDTNANALFVDGATGNVGISNTTPRGLLHVGTTASTTDIPVPAGNFAIVRGGLYNSPSTGGIQLSGGFGDAGRVAAWQIKAVGSGSGASFVNNLLFTTQNSFSGSETERMRIDSSGNVNVNSASGVSQLNLLRATGSVNGMSFQAAGWPYNVRAGMHGANGDTFYLSSNWTGSAVDSALFGTAFINVNANGYVAFGTGSTNTTPTEKMRIDASGNLLIGTATSGASKLRISGLPTSSAGLSAGDVWNDAGTLKIA